MAAVRSADPDRPLWREVVPRDDRAWPRGAFALSVALTLAAAGAGVALAIGAAGRGGWAPAFVPIGFGLAFAYGVGAVRPTMRQWIAGHPAPGRGTLLLGAGFAGGFLLLGLDDLSGGAVLAGLFGGTVATNAWSIRAARRNRGRVDAAEAAMASRSAPEVPIAGVRDARLGSVLRDATALQRQRAAAWLVAGVVTTAAGIILNAPGYVTVPVAMAAAGAFLWVVRRLWGAWLALRDVNAAATPPRRAFVVLLHDPAPRIIRPLLGVWSQAPVPRGGRLPQPERVYRCDDDQAGWASYRGGAVVHEAWVDTGPRRWSMPRWVTADAGIALPHRRALFGRWYLSSLLTGDRPGPPRPLTLAPPEPERALVVEEPDAGGSFPAAVAGRLAALTALALLLYALT